MKKIIVTSIALGVTVAAISITVAMLKPWSGAAEPSDELPHEVEETLPTAKNAAELPIFPFVPPLETGGIVRVWNGNAVVEMQMDEYLAGVVAAEMPVSFELEALAAQVVAARTYTLYSIHSAPKAAHEHADVCTDYRDCAAYKSEAELRELWGADYAANIAKIRTAVTVTNGAYLEYDSAPILAVFHSSSHGRTQDVENVWNTPLPYLVSVPSPETEADAPNLISSVTLSLSEFRAAVSAAFPMVRLAEDTSAWVADVTLDASGRVASLRLGGTAVTGVELRAALELRSAAITIEVGDEVTLTTAGYGHGVGMSQYGANAMAKSGKTWREILRSYYTGATLVGQTVTA